MASSREFLIDASTRHAIFVNRFAGSQTRTALQALNKLRDEVLAEVGKVDLNQATRVRLQRLYSDIEQLSDEVYIKLQQNVTRDLKDFAKYEAEFSKKMFDKVSKVGFVLPTATLINEVVFSSPMQLTVGKDRLSIEDSFKQFSVAKRSEMVNVIKNGILAGKTNQDIGRDIRLVSNKIQRNHAEALIRTVTNHTSSAARAATIQQNSDIIKGYRWVSTLDGRTTSTCQSLDGTVFPPDSATRPPLHWGCRSTMIPVLADDVSQGLDTKAERPAVGPDGSEQVSPQSTYNSWLKKQPSEFQDEVLGKTKAKLFRQGGLSLKQFTDRNYRPLTLNELKMKEPMAFAKAGLTEET